MINATTDSESDDEQIYSRMAVEAKEETHLLGQMEEDPEPPKTVGGKVKHFMTCNGYPLAVFLILVNEFCERFSFYGMRTVLTLYLKNHIGLGRALATEIFHGFNVLCYFTPLLGAVLADGFIGKYRTILYLSIVYGVGNTVMAVTAIPPTNIAGPIIGLLLIGFGTGGIKPCVSAFGGDQFAPDQTTQVARFFSIFYFSINAGSFFSTFITPILREDVECFGGNCYFAAFGLPAVLMIVAIIVFVSGKSYYKINPPSGNIIGQFCCSVGSALSNKWKYRNVKQEKESSFIYSASEKYERTFLSDVESVLGVLLMFLPLPIFWALYDQQGSTWTLQAERMDGDIGFMTIKPDQMQSINTVLIILFIPLFEAVIYPLVTKCGIPSRPLQRMSVGMVLAALSFVVAGFVQLSIEGADRPTVEAGTMRLRFVNTLPCGVQLSGSVTQELMPSQASTEFMMTSLEKGNDVTATSLCQGSNLKVEFKVDLRSENDSTVYLTYVGGKFKANQLDSLLQRPGEGNAKARLLCLRTHGDSSPHSLILSQSETLDWSQGMVFRYDDVKTGDVTEYNVVHPGSYHVFVTSGSNDTRPVKLETLVAFRQGGAYTAVLEPETAKQIPDVALYNDLEANSVSMLLQIPQYVIITAGEILFSVTGLAFAYAEAPQSMKSVVQAFWLLTMGVGNLLVMIFVAIHVSDSVTTFTHMPSRDAVAVEMFFYAGLLALDIIVFCLLSCFYHYRSITTDDDRNHSNNGAADDAVAMDTVSMSDAGDGQSVVSGEEVAKPSTSKEEP